MIGNNNGDDLRQEGVECGGHDYCATYHPRIFVLIDHFTIDGEKRNRGAICVRFRGIYYDC